MMKFQKTMKAAPWIGGLVLTAALSSAVFAQNNMMTGENGPPAANATPQAPANAPVQPYGYGPGMMYGYGPMMGHGYGPGGMRGYGPGMALGGLDDTQRAAALTKLRTVDGDELQLLAGDTRQ